MEYDPLQGCGLISRDLFNFSFWKARYKCLYWRRELTGMVMNFTINLSLAFQLCKAASFRALC